VLIKNDMTACIADFGLATSFEHDDIIGSKHGQVGFLLIVDDLKFNDCTASHRICYYF
jgi:hypothetical protein